MGLVRLHTATDSSNHIRSALGVALAVGLLTLGVTACTSDITQPELFFAVKCEPPALLLAGANSPPFAFGALHEAFRHAAGPMTLALGSSEKVNQLKRALDGLARQEKPETLDTSCRLLQVASEVLASLPNNPETLPDRDGIRLVLILAARAVKAEQ